MIHKYTAIILCALLIATSLSSCKKSAKSDSETDKPDGTTATTTVATTTTTPPIEPPKTQPDPLQNEKNAIKDQVIVFMADEDSENPYELFDQFLGDYYISNFETAYEDSEPYNRIYQKDGVMVTDTKDGVVYTIASPLQKVNATLVNDKISIVNTVDLEKAPIPSIFDDFGFDISVVYSQGDEINFSDLELTANMLTVSDDLLTCRFSDDYMNSIATLFCQSLELDEQATQEFLDSCLAEGVYHVDDKKAVFTVSGTDATLGDIRFTVTFQNNPDRQIHESTIKVEYALNVDGMRVPVSNELLIENEKYSSSTNRGFSFKNILTAETSMEQNGIMVTSTAVTTSTYSIRPNGDFSAYETNLQKVSAQGYSSEQQTSRHLQYHTNTSFSYEELDSGSIRTIYLSARDCKIGAHDLTLPQAVLDYQTQINQTN